MKIHHLLPLLILASSFPCHGQEGNPFMKKDGVKPPPMPAGTAFHDLVEYVSVPAEVLNPWLDQHPISGDADPLRRQAQTWISEKKAALVHTLFSTGSQNHETSNDSVVEQIYPTEFIPSAPGTWLYPSAFETRNMGINIASSAASGGDGRMEAQATWVALQEPATCYHPLTEQTRKPGDMFLPKFWQVDLHQADVNSVTEGYDPFSPGRIKIPHRPSFSPGKTYLAGRVDLPRQDPLAAESSLLVFFRGVNPIQGAPAGAAAEKAPAEFTVSARRVEMPQGEFSAWLQGQELGNVSSAAWEAVSGHINAGTAKAVSDLTIAGRKGMRGDVEQVEELIYPTEYEDPKDKTVSPEAFSAPTAFETRNLGRTMNAALSEDGQGLVLDLSIERVELLRNAVMRRIRVGTEWVPDMTMPVFASYRFHGVVRPRLGKWMLVSSGPVFSEMGQPVAEKICLVFVKVD